MNTVSTSHKAHGDNNICIGINTLSLHNNCILLGAKLTSDEDYQIKIGDKAHYITAKLTEDEYVKLSTIIKQLVEGKTVKSSKEKS